VDRLRVTGRLCTSLKEGLVDVFGDFKAFFPVHQGAALVGRHQTFFLGADVNAVSSAVRRTKGRVKNDEERRTMKNEEDKEPHQRSRAIVWC
jgi:hypothetical protein